MDFPLNWLGLFEKIALFKDEGASMRERKAWKSGRGVVTWSPNPRTLSLVYFTMIFLIVSQVLSHE